MTAFSRRGFVSRDIAQFNIKQSHYSNNRNKTLTNNALSRCCPTSSYIVDVLSKKFSSMKTPISSETIQASTEQQAKELTSKMTSEERKLFLAALNECKSKEEKAGYEGKHIVCFIETVRNLYCKNKCDCYNNIILLIFTNMLFLKIKI